MLEQEMPMETRQSYPEKRPSWIIGLASLFFILLQSACSALMALSGLRLVLGIGSLAAAAAGVRLLASLHGGWIRISMETFAVAGSVINLYAISRVRSLRARPSSQWRMAPVSTEKKRAEFIQSSLAIVTLLLVAVEWAFHVYLHHSI